MQLQEFGERSALAPKGSPLPQDKMPAPVKGSVCRAHSRPSTSVQLTLCYPLQQISCQPDQQPVTEVPQHACRPLHVLPRHTLPLPGYLLLGHLPEGAGAPPGSPMAQPS